MLSLRELTEEEMLLAVGGTPPTDSLGNQYFCAPISATGASPRYEVMIYNVHTGKGRVEVWSADPCNPNHNPTTNDVLSLDQIKSELGPSFESRLEARLGDIMTDANRITDEAIQNAIRNMPAPDIEVHDNSGLDEGGSMLGSGSGNHSSVIGDGRGNTFTPSPGAGGGKAGVVDISE